MEHDDGRPVGVVRYEIEITQNVLDGGIPGPGRIEGKLDMPLAARDLVGQPLRLQLEDGRVWHFSFHDNRGYAVNRGQGLQPPTRVNAPNVPTRRDTGR